MVYNNLKKGSVTLITIGVLLNALDGSYQESLWKGLVDEAKTQGINLIIYPGKPINSPVDDDMYHNSVFYSLPMETLDGIIIASAAISTYVTQREYEKFLSFFKDKPLISIGRSIPGIPSIRTNNSQSIGFIMDHLINVHGLKNIAFIKGPENNPEAVERYKTYCEYLSRYNLPKDPNLVVPGSFDAASGFEGVRTLLDKRAVTCEAIVCANDGMAVGALLELKSRGIKVPEDIILTGFDGNEDLEFLLSGVPITTIQQPIFEMGQEAIRMILKEIRGGEFEYEVEIPGSPHFRKSCGCEEDVEEGVLVDYLKSEMHKKVAMQRIMANMRSITTEISGVEDLSDLKNAIYKRFPGLGLSSFFLSLYQHTEEYIPGEVFNMPQFSKVVIAYRDGKRLLTDNDQVDYSSRGFIPEELLDNKDPFVLIVQPLLNKETQYGLLIHSLDEGEAVIYGSLREQVSSALKTVYLSREREEAERKLMFTMQKLKHSEENFRKMAYLLPTLLFETDIDMNLTFMNKTTLELFGYDSNDILNKSLTSMLNIDNMGKIAKYCQKIMTIGSSSSFLEFKMKTVSGEEVALLGKASPIFYEDRIEGFRWSAINIKLMIGSLMKTEHDFFDKFNLTKREREVLNLLLEGNKNRMIAEKLFIAESTVKDHLGAIYSKMNVKNRQALFVMLEESQRNIFGPESFLISIISRIMK